MKTDKGTRRQLSEAATAFLMEQMSMASGQLHAGVAAALQAGGCIGGRIDKGGQFVRGHFLWHGVEKIVR